MSKLLQFERGAASSPVHLDPAGVRVLMTQFGVEGPDGRTATMRKLFIPWFSSEERPVDDESRVIGKSNVYFGTDKRQG